MKKPLYDHPEKLVIDAMVSWCPRIGKAERTESYTGNGAFYYRCDVKLLNGNNFNGNVEMQGSAILEGLVLAHKKVLELTKGTKGCGKEECGTEKCSKVAAKTKKVKRAVIKKAMKIKPGGAE